MGQTVQNFVSGGVGMYPILVAGIVLLVASIRYAIDTEPIRLRFIKALSLVQGSLMLFWGVSGAILVIEGVALASEADRTAGIREGIAGIVNTWGLGLLFFVLASMAIAVGAYRSGRRELKALKP